MILTPPASTVVTGLALLAVATTVTNMLMSYALSMKMVYNKHKVPLANPDFLSRNPYLTTDPA
jgi:hypothetical protein